MSKLQKIAEDIAYADKNIVINPALIPVIIEVLISLIKLYQSCNKEPKDMSKDSGNLNFIQRWRLRRLIRNKTQDEVLVTTISKAINSKNYSEEEIQEVWKEING